MKKNMGTTDRLLRAILGLIIILLGFIYQSWWGIIGIIPLLTSLMGSCPLYVPFKLSTIKKKDNI